MKTMLQMNQIRMLVLMQAVIFLFAANHCSGLTCCIGNITLTVSNKTDEDQTQGDPCTNHGFSCKDISCPEKTCTTHDTDPDTICANAHVCNMVKPVCRILYYDFAEDQDDPEEEQSVALEKDIKLTYFVEQACFENAYDDVTIGCEFFPKIFYESARTRKTYQKECFCDTDRCNENLVNVCLQTDPDLKGKHKNYTCWELAAGTPKFNFRQEDKHITGLSIFANIFISMHFSRKLY